VPRPVSFFSPFRGPFLRVVALAFFSIGGALWALVRYYTHPRQPMVVVVPRPAPTFDADAGEIEVPPEFLEDDAGS
jgi:hypothetical protein